MDPVFLSRVQFGVSISFHYLFPPMSIGLGLILVIMEAIYLKTRKALYAKMTRFWVKVFALTFAIGVATGVIQVFAFGTNWGRFSHFVGDVFGSALGAEGIFAFFLEAGFLSILLFGWHRVSAGWHFFSTLMVCLGAHFSAFWILIANSWMQTPAGFELVTQGDQVHAVVTDLWAMMFNPSSLDRIWHTVQGCWLVGAFMVISISAFYLLKRRHLDFARASMKIGLWVGCITIVLQLISADSTARGVAVNQPAKLAAMEGVFKTEASTPLWGIGFVDLKNQEVKGIGVPGMLSFLVHHNMDTPVIGLDQFAREDWPNVPLVFQCYHLMIAMWALMFLALLLALMWNRRKKLENAGWLLKTLVVAVVLPQIANLAGWFTAEFGRQPWVVQGILRTSHGASRAVSGGTVLWSVITFSLLYVLMGALFIYLLNDKIQHGPDEEEHIPFRDQFQQQKEVS